MKNLVSHRARLVRRGRNGAEDTHIAARELLQHRVKLFEPEFAILCKIRNSVSYLCTGWSHEKAKDACCNIALDTRHPPHDFIKMRMNDAFSATQPLESRKPQHS